MTVTYNMLNTIIIRIRLFQMAGSDKVYVHA